MRTHATTKTLEGSIAWQGESTYVRCALTVTCCPCTGKRAAGHRWRTNVDSPCCVHETRAPASLYTQPRPYFAAMPTSTATTLMDARAMDRTLRRMADEIVEHNGGTEDLIVVGIQRRGVQLADRIVRIIGEREGTVIPRGALDITLYRDDLQTVGPRPVVGPTHIPWAIEGKRIVIVDDVLYTGRTVRAALDELADFGRPSRIALAVLVDRGGRELPIHADIVGRKVDVPSGDYVDVLVEELDARDAVVVMKPGPEA